MHLKKIINVFFIVLFVLFAGLQYNDPDPFVWIGIYLYGALLCYMAIRNRYEPNLYTLGITFYSLYAVYLLFDTTGVISWITDHNGENIVQSMKADKPWIEETREFFGLIILSGTLLMNKVWLKNNYFVSEPANADT